MFVYIIIEIGVNANNKNNNIWNMISHFFEMQYTARFYSVKEISYIKKPNSSVLKSSFVIEFTLRSTARTLSSQPIGFFFLLHCLKNMKLVHDANRMT